MDDYTKGVLVGIGLMFCLYLLENIVALVVAEVKDDEHEVSDE